MKNWKYWRYVFLLVAVGYYFCISDSLFDDPFSTILESRKGELLSATIADDGQWRFPPIDSVPDKFSKALVLFEDKRFFRHPGVDIFSMSRAIKDNISAGHVVSGGSTITMQVVRLSRKGKSRTIWEKFIEIILATRLELRYSKEEILKLYSSHAPFGGNVVGIEAACWRYFGRDPRTLSWSEACLLAVLPNAPSLIHPGRNRELLLAKRNALLDRLKDNNLIDTLTCQLSKEESIPDKPQPLPRHARHLLTRVMKDGKSHQKIASTIDLDLQTRAEQIVDDHHQLLKSNQIFNAAAIVLEVETGEVLAYVGNTYVSDKNSHGDEVDIIRSPRSTGSILKPFLYGAMLDEGRILPNTLLPDVPTIVSGFAPKNFSNDYDGAVAADKALIRSLNVPAVQLLMEYRYEKFHSLLQHLGMSTLVNDADHYGLSLILGGAEGTLWDISGMYASMARTLNHYFEHPGKYRYDRNDYFPPSYLNRNPAEHKLEENSWLSASSIYQVFEILKEVYRPGEQTGWKYFSSSQKIAWKTGTSFGFRDGWAVGVTGDYVVGVWVGNADGEGRPGLTGTETAAPIMFDIFSQLPAKQWFDLPLPEMTRIEVCNKSGMRVSTSCHDIDTAWVSNSGLQSQACTYHKMIHLSKDKKFRVHADCESLTQMIDESWFVLPPIEEYYYRAKNLSYKTLPAFRSDCQPPSLSSNMEMIYPKEGSRIYIPRELNGSLGKVVIEIAHRNPKALVFWHLDDEYLGTTTRTHRIPIQTGAGSHKLTLVDDSGEVLEREFEVASSL